MTERYEIRVSGSLGPLLRAIFGGMRCQSVPSQSTIRGQLTDEDLHRLLHRLDESGVELVELSRAPGDLPAPVRLEDAQAVRAAPATVIQQG